MRARPTLIAITTLALGLVPATGGAVQTEIAEDHAAHGHTGMSAAHAIEHQKHLDDRQAPFDLPALVGAATPCVDGDAAGYPCENVDLLSFLPLADIGGGSGNDSWGWTDPVTGREWALMGRSSGTSFVDISDPVNPFYAGNLPTATSNSSWRDIKVYADHAFVVSEAGSHGMQVFDLSRLRDVTPAAAPVTFTADARYTGFGDAHNLAINEETGYAYGVGANVCSGGLAMVDIRIPTSPQSAGCFSADGYTHDAQCVIYRGLDEEHVGSEICFNYNEDTVTIVDVTDKSATVQLSRTGYSGSRYTHQGWLSEDHAWLAMDDELDETGLGHTTRTRYLDLRDLDAPVLRKVWTNGNSSIDHNLYTKDGIVYQANYRSGLRIYPFLGSAELGFFDIYPANDSPSFNGAWSTFPYYDSGVVIISGIEQGLFIVRPNVEIPPGPPSAPTTVDALDASASGDEIAVSGSASFSEETRVLGIDSATDARPRFVGAELSAASVASAYTDGDALFTLRLTAPDQPAQTGGTPEAVRYVWDLTVEGAGASGTFALEAFRSAQGIDAGSADPVFRLLDAAGAEVARPAGTLGGGLVEIQLPASALGASDGTVVRAAIATQASGGGSANVTQAALDSISPVDAFVVPGATVRVGVGPAGADPATIALTHDAAVDAGGGFSATIPAAGGQQVVVLACFGPLSCALGSTEVAS